MCRKNQLFAWTAIAFGVGISVGVHLGAGFFTSCVCLGVIIFGFSMFRKKQA